VIVAPPPAAALAVSPVRVELAGAGTATIRLTNTGGVAAIVDGARAGFAIDARGRPRTAALRDRGVQILVRPQRLVLAPGAAEAATIHVRLARDATPGDHASLVVFATRPRGAGGVGVRLRIGVIVVVRAPGAVVHRLRLVHVRLVRRILEIDLRNRGNVVERLGPASLQVRLVRGGRVLRRLRVPMRELLPGGRALLRLAAPPTRGRIVVELDGGDGSTSRAVRDLRAGV
jgi:hypothetical protein